MSGPNLWSEKYTCCSRENPSLVQHVRSLRIVHNIWPPIGVPDYALAAAMIILAGCAVTMPFPPFSDTQP